MRSLILSLPLTSLALASPLPQFAGIGPWEGEFFGADPGQQYRHGLTSYAAPMMVPEPGIPYGYPNGVPVNPYDPYNGQLQTYPGGAPIGFISEPEAPPPPPPEPIDLMTAPKEKLPQLAPAPPPPKPEEPEAKGPAEASGAPKKKGAPEEDFDFMGGKWGIAGQGKYIDAARGEHKLPAGAERDRDDRRGRYGRFGLGYSEEEERKEPEKEPEKKEKVVEKKKEKMPPVEVEQDPDHPLRYNVHIGGIKTGPDDETGPSDFHVFTDETTKKMSSNDMNPETERYIREKMMPKLSGRRKKGGNGGGNIFSVFGDGN
ncbi:hypothetical protein K440DRAFT_645552 [Wilcoxina mikolae CBS 423.85]|nr:hypothetical protein K440DRAFT_645552 [Wilcoxina mikolae CBS 423.85]